MFFVYNTVVVQPLAVKGSAQSLGDSVIVTFTTTKPAMFQCKIDNGKLFPCKSIIKCNNIITSRNEAYLIRYINSVYINSIVVQ